MGAALTVRVSAPSSTVSAISELISGSSAGGNGSALATSMSSLLGLPASSLSGLAATVAVAPRPPPSPAPSPPQPPSPELPRGYAPLAPSTGITRRDVAMIGGTLGGAIGATLIVFAVICAVRLCWRSDKLRPAPAAAASGKKKNTSFLSFSGAAAAGSTPPAIPPTPTRHPSRFATEPFWGGTSPFGYTPKGGDPSDEIPETEEEPVPQLYSYHAALGTQGSAPSTALRAAVRSRPAQPPPGVGGGGGGGLAGAEQWTCRPGLAQLEAEASLDPFDARPPPKQGMLAPGNAHRERVLSAASAAVAAALGAPMPAPLARLLPLPAAHHAAAGSSSEPQLRSSPAASSSLLPILPHVQPSAAGRRVPARDDSSDVENAEFTRGSSLLQLGAEARSEGWEAVPGHTRVRAVLTLAAEARGAPPPAATLLLPPRGGGVTGGF